LIVPAFNESEKMVAEHGIEFNGNEKNYKERK
jgi:hypothetical protein